jgi:putative ABC transport system permease protein
VLRYIYGQFRHRPSRTLTLGAGILVAAVGFTLLTAAADTGQLRIRGTIGRNFRAAYDILVRPPGSSGVLERREGLVADNFASGIFGGITLQQWHEVLNLPGVEAAAPIANLGYIAPFERVRFTINRLLNADPVQLYRLRLTWRADRGTSQYPGEDSFIYYTRVDPISRRQYEILPNGRRLGVCFGFGRGQPPQTGPFRYSTPAGWHLQCFSALSRGTRIANPIPFSHGRVGSATDVLYPVLVAAVDPVQENRLLGLRHAVVAGRSLAEGDGPSKADGVTALPVVVSSRTYVDEPLDVAVQRLDIPPGVDVPGVLASDRAFAFTTHLPGTTIARFHYSSDALWQREIRELSGTAAYWSVTPASYRPLDSGYLAPQATSNPANVYLEPGRGEVAAPGNQDVQFRRLRRHVVADGAPPFRFSVVGRYDPRKLPGFSPLSQVPLAAYAPPLATPANASSRQALHGRPLLPSMNLGGYIQQPPFVLTTLSSVRFLERSNVLGSANPQAPISVIRVRVAGVNGPDPLSLARIRTVAQLIEQRTHLTVDITAGSSPHPVLVDLPAGRYGRPPLLLQEGWTKKGVAVAILLALDRKSLALFVLVLAVCSLFLANGAVAAVRSRRRELGTLLSLGWSQGRVFRSVILELAVIGFTAGLVGGGLALVLTLVLHLRLSALRALVVLPVAVMLAVLAGLPSAVVAARSVPLDALGVPVTRRARGRGVRRTWHLAMANLRRLPGRTLLGAGGLFIGVGALTVLLAVNLAFRGALVGSLLGGVVSIQVRTADLASVILTVALGGFAVADVLMLNLRERAVELAALRAAGWSEGNLGGLVALEGAGMGLIGSVPGGVVGGLLAVAVGRSHYANVFLVSGVAAIAGTLVGLMAALVPAALVARMALPVILAEE